VAKATHSYQLFVISYRTLRELSVIGYRLLVIWVADDYLIADYPPGRRSLWDRG